MVPPRPRFYNLPIYTVEELPCHSIVYSVAMQQLVDGQAMYILCCADGSRYRIGPDALLSALDKGFVRPDHDNSEFIAQLRTQCRPVHTTGGYYWRGMAK